MELTVVPIIKPDAVNFIFGQSHFIKTVEDLHEALVGAVPGIRFGLSFCEASDKRLVRWSGNDEAALALARDNALAIGAGHTFLIFLGDGFFPVNVLAAVRAVPEVCRIYCATANPTQVIVAQTELGRGILGVVDGASPLGVETDADIVWRHHLRSSRRRDRVACVDGPLDAREKTRSLTGGSIAIMCPACRRGAMTAGPDGVRDPVPNTDAASQAFAPSGFSGSSVRPIVISFSSFTPASTRGSGVTGCCRSAVTRVIVTHASRAISLLNHGRSRAAVRRRSCRSRPGGSGRVPIHLPARHQRPCHPGHLVGECHGDDFSRLAQEQSPQPFRH